MKLFIKILSWFLHHANRGYKDPFFYKVKNIILLKYGKHVCYDIQFIEGKRCFSCDGTGIYSSWNGNFNCDRCYDGWYKQPVWNILSKVQFGEYYFHQPYQRTYIKPEDIQIPIIEGYITHQYSKHSNFCRIILFLFYEKGYLKRWFKSVNGYRVYWYYPRNWAHNIAYLIKKRKVYTDDLPF